MSKKVKEKKQTVLEKQQGIACQCCKYYHKPLCIPKKGQVFGYTARKNSCEGFVKR